jgi:hypothetical protein
MWIVGQLQFMDYEDWYRGDRRDVLQAGLTKQMDKAQHRGCSGVRICGNALQPSPDSAWSERVRYEQTLHELVVTTDLALLCAYRLGVFLPQTVKNDLLQSHHAALFMENDDWEYVPTSK